MPTRDLVALANLPHLYLLLFGLSVKHHDLPIFQVLWGSDDVKGRLQTEYLVKYFTVTRLRPYVMLTLNRSRDHSRNQNAHLHSKFHRDWMIREVDR